MSEAYVECLVKGRPNNAAKAGKIALIVVAVLLVAAAILTRWYLLMFLAIGAGVGAYFVSQYTDVEYEYLYIDKELVIDKIFNQAKRKRIATYDFAKVQVIAPIKSYHLDNFGKVSDKAKDYSIGTVEQPDLRYVLFYEGQEQVIFSPNEELVKIMKNAAPRKVFND